jgi:acetyl esterase/lipase
MVDDEWQHKPVVLTLPRMGEARITKDIVYKSVDGLDLTMDVYRPGDEDTAGSHPAVILVSGTGPWEMVREGKNWAVYVSYGRLIAAMGLIAVNFIHRSPYPPLDLNVVAEDVDDALIYIRREASNLGIDAERLALWAFSGGASFGFRSALRGLPPYIRCLVSYYALLDFRHFQAEAGLAPNEDPEEFSPAHYLEDSTRPIPPVFVAKAGQDQPKLNESIDRFVRAALAANMTLDLMTHPAGVHGFDFLTDDRRSREIILRTLEFLEEHLAH